MTRFFFVCALLLSGLLLSNCHGGGDATAPARDTVAAAPDTRKTILFFGNSLTAGYGLPETKDAFPSLLQNKIDALHLPYKTVNAGNSGETSAGGLGRIGWVLRQPVDIFVLELGANDGLRGLPVDQTSTNLQAIIDSVRLRYPHCRFLLLGMQVPPNLGQQYTADFKAIFPALAAKNNTQLVPFLLQGVGGVPTLNQGDGIHPNVEGERMVADNVWAVLKGML
ncbi:arylesterase [Dinghuibacter silviterrae]|uniref:Acyl-CoA thioesterase-1 n=1 Tax=Dinghuibacter silviterrae TaxID=1539049 RepID=A0A4V3GKW5_9BACT|nr:arylesterase [Dinghuibacter silviterrae]TDW97212.1 acyl-CoA thioesterase-1 [Dinghuibacter silviterrae]